jgi:hypothetical protein
MAALLLSFESVVNMTYSSLQKFGWSNFFFQQRLFDAGRSIAGEPPKKGGILDALRRSPLVGANLNLVRSRETGRKVDL